MRDAVDGHAAFETDAHSAERGALSTSHRVAEMVNPRIHDRDGDGGAVIDRDIRIVNG